MEYSNQVTLFDDESIIGPGNVWDQKTAQGALDELFSLTFQYKTSKAFQDLLQFVGRFGFYSPFNAMLVHIQMPGAQYVASPYRWLSAYGRKIKAGARPLVILKPMGPVMFVFDVSDTEGKPLPPEIEKPFAVRQGSPGVSLHKTIENSKRDGIAIHTARLGSQQGGSVRIAEGPWKNILFKDTFIPVRYQIELDEGATEGSRYASLAHELAHLYCGHLGTPNQSWWPDRRGLSHAVCEVEAESVAFMVCTRMGIDNPSEQYLAGFVKDQANIPTISLECVMKTAGLIEKMGKENLKPRKEKMK